MENDDLIMLIMAVISVVACLVINIIGKEKRIKLIFMIPLFIAISPAVCVFILMWLITPLLDYLEI